MKSIPLFRVSLAAIATMVFVACHRGPAISGTSAQPNAAVPPAVPVLPTGVTVAMIAEGDSLFNNRSCVRCHGAKGVGSANAPSLVRTSWDHGSGSYADIVKTIISGVPKESFKVPTRPFAMRARGGMEPLLTDAQVNAVAAYVWSLNHARR